MRRVFVLILLVTPLACCSTEEGKRPRPESRIEPSAPPPEESRPFREGFTQRPPKDAPWLPARPAPLVDEIPEEGLDRASGAASDAAQAEILGLVADFGREGSPEIVSGIRQVAVAHIEEGRVSYLTAEAFYEEYIYPRDIDEADEAYRGKVVVLTGSVAPHNMLDLPDGFKLFERTPYVHEPVLLATGFELAFIRCHLARRELQKLLDWQEVHILGVVEGKLQGDLVLRRCVVL